MTTLFGQELPRAELTRRVGKMAQIAGVRRSTLVEGTERGVDVVEFRTGTGFNFTVVPSRGMDIATAEWCGTPLAWQSPTGIVNPEFFEPQGKGWLRGFFGGLLTTCGLTNVGLPCVDEGEELGQHGRISYIPARHVHCDTRWEGNNYILFSQGRMREVVLGSYDIALTRNITAKVGESRLFLTDIVENLGHKDAPFMLLYHINVGFPVLDDGSELVVATQGVTPRDEVAEKGVAERFRFGPPTVGFEEQVFYHDVIEDENRHVWVAVVNKRFNNGQGIGLYVKYHKTQFPNLVEWKMTGEGLYVVGIEPANCHVEGRAAERARGTLQFVEAGGKRHFETEIGVLKNIEEIEAFEEKVARIRSRKNQA